MTPDKFERAQELIEAAYVSGNIDKITFLRRMSALGFNNMDRMRELLAELDKQRDA